MCSLRSCLSLSLKNCYSWIPAFAGMATLLLSGCISIGTHERAMKQCRNLSDRLALVEKEKLELEQQVSQKTEQTVQLEQHILDVRTTYDQLVQDLKDEIAEGSVGVKAVGNEIQVTLGSALLFKTGEAALQKRGEKTLQDIAKSFKTLKEGCMRVEGHTDNRPISASLKSRYPTNWYLSGARAASVIRYLEEKGGVGPARLALHAFADQRPLQSNKTPEGRQQNRRVEIFFIPCPKP